MQWRRTRQLLDIGEVGVDSHASIPTQSAGFLAGASSSVGNRDRLDLLEELEERTLGEHDLGAVPIEQS